MSHKDDGYQGFYAGPNQGQQYRCILCGVGGGSGGTGSSKPLTYHCHNKECNGQSTMWPTPQYALYLAMNVERDALRTQLAKLQVSHDQMRDRKNSIVFLQQQLAEQKALLAEHAEIFEQGLREIGFLSHARLYQRMEQSLSKIKDTPQ